MTDQQANAILTRLGQLTDAVHGLAETIGTQQLAIETLNERLSRPPSSELPTLLRTIVEELRGLPVRVALEVARAQAPH